MSTSIDDSDERGHLNGGNSPSGSSRSQRGAIISYIFATVALAVALIVTYVQLSRQVVALNESVSSLQKDLNDLRYLLDRDIKSTKVLEVNYVTIAKNMTDFVDFKNRTEIQIAELESEFYLFNHTSNAEVLAILDNTQRYITSELTLTREDVNKTMNTMKKVVRSATSEIYTVQKNVTSQLAEMSLSLLDTVNVATDTIHEEVRGVKDDIEKYVVVTNQQFDAENDFVKYQLAGTFTLLACLMSLWHVTSHLRNLNKPDVQRRVMAILWMVPVYSITSWFSLVFPKAEPFLSSIRDLYEAYVVYTFIALLIAILEDERGLSGLLRSLTRRVIEERQAILVDAELRAAEGFLEDSNAKKPEEHLKPPWNCCYVYEKPSSVAATWLYQCKLMAMQFVISKPILALIPFICKWSHYDYDGTPLYFDDHSINWNSVRLYILFISNISVCIAFYGLLSFYHGVSEDLAWCEPWPKFLCIKGVVFVTFWQGAALQAMGSFGLVHEKAAMQIQNLLICIEMLLASLAHFYIFPYHEWQEGYKEVKESEQKYKIQIKDTLALKDFVKDVKLMVTKGWEGSGGGDLSESIHDSPTFSDDGVELVGDGSRGESSDLITGARKWMDKARGYIFPGTASAAGAPISEYDALNQTETNPMTSNMNISTAEIEQFT